MSAGDPSSTRAFVSRNSAFNRLVPALQGRAVLWGVVFLFALLGLALRLVAARGDLWLDEIWSFALIEPLTSIDQIFWRINHDNNHFLNSLYLYLVGPDASAPLQRGLSIAMGTALILASARVMQACGRATQIVTALLFAISYPMVHYGSEARGYIGLVLATVLAVFFTQRRLEGRRSLGLALAATILLGFLSHLTMIGTAVVLFVWAGWLLLREKRGFVGAASRLGSIFAPAVYALVPLAACILVGDMLFGFRVGGYEPFTLEAFASGYGGMIKYLFGLPAQVPDWLCIALVGCLVTTTAWRWPDRRSSLYILGIVGLPALMAAAHLPNLSFPRYFIVSGTLLLVWAGELLGRGLAAAGIGRIAAAGALAAILLGNAISLRLFYENGRGAYSAMVEMMTDAGPAQYAAGSEFRTRMTVDFFAARRGRQAVLIPRKDACKERPTWYILEEPDPPARMEPFDCGLAYERVAASRPWGLSGLPWALYRRVDRGAHALNAVEARRLTLVIR